MNSRKILIVEDNEFETEALEIIISSIDKSFKIIKTGLAEKALNKAKEDEIALFIIDLQLKDYPGFGLADKIRKLKNHKMTPIIFIAGNMNREIFAFKTYHCYDYIIKPYNKEQVSKTIQTVLLNEKDEAVFRFCQRRTYFDHCEPVYL